MKFSSVWPKAMGAIALFTLVACGSEAPDAAVPASPSTAPSTINATPIVETVASTEATLAAGRYCYEAATDTLDAAVRLTVAADGQVRGDGIATVSDEENSYYTSYRQALTGRLSGTELALEVKTWIEYDQQTETETWTIEGDRLSDGNTTFTQVECDAVRDRFVGETGIEADDLLSAATNVNTQRVRFERGKNSTVVSSGVVRGDRDVYLLGAQGGQTMTLSITALEDNAAFDVVSPAGDVLVLEGTDEEVFLPYTGDYKVIVGGTRGNASYELTIGIQ